jgi:hypothetical protein
MASFVDQKDLLHRTAFRISCLVLCWGAVFGCAKIADFSEPHMSEVFMGNCTITPSVKGISASARPVCTVGIEGDSSGKTVTIHGIPTNEPFPVIPTKLWDFLHKTEIFPTFPPTISGFTADVIDKATLKVTGFADQSDEAKELGLEATGTIVRQGPQMATTKDDPIVISAKVRSLRTSIGDIYLEKITRVEDDKPITEFADNDMIPLYRIDFRPEIVTVF